MMASTISSGIKSLTVSSDSSSEDEMEVVADEYRSPILDEQVIREVTGKDDLYSVTNLEMIFTPTPGLEVLSKLPNLCKLTLIGTQLRSIPASLASVGKSLESLALVNQSIRKIQELNLPNLKELFLQNNEITKIENLAGVPQLRRLWLNDNAISKMENLYALGDLRELCLSGNKISDIEGFESLSTLRDLQVSANPISSFKSVQKLATLDSLRELSFADKGYLPCPVAQLEGYKSFVLCALKQVRVLDGVQVDTTERKYAQDEYLERVLEFNDKIDDIRREHEKELLQVENKRQQVMHEADTLHHQLSRAFSDLEHVVKQGRERIHTAQQQQVQLRESNLDALKAGLEKVQNEFMKKIDTIIEEEVLQGEREEADFARLEELALFDMNESLLLCELQQPSPTASSALTVHVLLGGEDVNTQSMSAELKSLNHLIQTSQQNSEGATLKLLRAAKVSNPGLLDKQRTLLAEKHSEVSEMAVDMPYYQSQYFVGIDISAVKRSLRTGVLENVKNFVFLFSDPKLAVEFTNASSVQEIGDETHCADDTCKLHRMFICSVVKLGSCSTSQCTPSQASSADHLNMIANNTPINSTVEIQVSHDGECDTSSILCAPASHVVVESYVVLKHCTGEQTPRGGSLDELLQSAIGKEQKLSNNGSDVAMLSPYEHMEISAADKAELEALEASLHGQYVLYEQRVMQELDPQSFNNLAETSSRVRELKDTLKSLRSKIDNEKANQEQLLREFKGSRRRRQ